MKKIFNQTIIVCILLNLIMAGFAVAQDVAVQENQIDRTDVKEVARAGYGAATNMYKNAFGNIRSTGVAIPHLHQGGSGSVLVIPSDQMKMENLAAINEDMNVMSRIFDKKLGQSDVFTTRGRLFAGFNPFLFGGNRTTEAIYLEDYGALFLVKVNMLLSAPPEEPKEEKSEGEDTDPLWAEVRSGLYEPGQADKRRSNGRSQEKYDAEKVEDLKTNLIKTLKHATNIRGLEPEQLVILTVIGNGHQSNKIITRSYSYSSRGSGSSYSRSSSPRRIVQTTPGDQMDSLLPTVLTICAKKSDIDAFAKGELDYDQFRKRTGIFKSYAQAGQQTSLGLEEYEVAEANAGL